MFKFSELKTIHLEISSRCQASCPMCPRNYHGNIPNPNLPLNDWTLDNFKYVFNEETLNQVESIYFCGNFGDPIMNNDLINMCQYIKDNKPTMNVRIHTNGGARNKQWWKDLAIALPQDHVVIFALDGLEDTHSLYRIGTTYEQVTKNAKSFIDNNGIAEWVYIKFKHNEHQVSIAEERAKILGFKRFTVKNTIRFIGEPKFPVYDKEGNTLYNLEPPTNSHVTLIDVSRINKFKEEYKEITIDCYAKKNKELYIDAQGNMFPCCFLASQPYNYPNKNPMVSDIRLIMDEQYKILVNSLGNTNCFELSKTTLNRLVDGSPFQEVWQKFWGSDKLITCARVCGQTNVSKPSEQFESRNIIND